MITSSQNSKLKLVRALMGRAKERRAESAFVAEGVRLVEEAVNSNWGFRFVLYDETLSERGALNVKRLTSLGVECDEIPFSLMKSVSDTETSQGILAVLQFTNLPTLAPGASAAVPNSPTFILIPDQIRDPGNLGTLIRSADAAGVDAVLIPPETTDPFAPKVVRAGMGAHFRLPIVSMGWEEIEALVGTASHQTRQDESTLSGATQTRVMVADMEGESCWEMDLSKPLALVIGGEAEGASEAARKLASAKIKIPMAGKTESLNAAVAGSVLMFEVLRQRAENSE
ncbi:MAG: RNA methyltransferase [Chloroflexi bacterium]|nr:RNA methyltransferase [Chloroflexota bacterium]